MFYVIIRDYSIALLNWIVLVKVPFPLPQQDACKNGITCPLDPNMVYMEVITMPIMAEYPAVIFLSLFYFRLQCIIIWMF